MMDFIQEIKRLQRLSCIALTPKEEQKLGSQIADIVNFLAQLQKVKINNPNNISQKNNLTLRTIKNISQASDSIDLLQNVKHSIINNSIVIKSSLH